jgi:hypothetical protein
VPLHGLSQHRQGNHGRLEGHGRREVRRPT